MAETPFDAVVIAGGRGTRLAPYTLVLPKPLLPVGERPILDLVLERLAAEGCRRVTVSVGYLAPLIETYCGDGGRWGLEVGYFREEEPLGTVGAIGRVPCPDRAFIVMNGDVLTDLSFQRLLEAHAEAGADLTIGAFRRRVRDEFGILVTDEGGRLVDYVEKPEHEHLVSMGVYVFAPSAVERIRSDERLDFPDLVLRLLGDGGRVHVHEHRGEWLDMGRPDDFARANEAAPGGEA